MPRSGVEQTLTLFAQASQLKRPSTAHVVASRFSVMDAGKCSDRRVEGETTLANLSGIVRQLKKERAQVERPWVGIVADGLDC
jgi:hypothetical protein